MNPMGSGQIAEACFFFSGLCADSQATWRAQGKDRTPLWHEPCQARQPQLLEILLLSFTSAATRKARRPDLVKNKSRNNLIGSKQGGWREASPYNNFFGFFFFFLQNCLPVSQSTAASNNTKCFIKPLLSKHFPFSLLQLAMKHHQLPHKGSASDMHWRCLWPWPFIIVMSTQNLQKGDIKGEREGFLTSRLILTRAMWGAIF